MFGDEFLDGSSVLQGKLEGCTVNSQGVTLNHTTYYLNPDAHSFRRAPVLSRKKTRMPVFSVSRSSRNSRHKALRKSCTNPCRNCLPRTSGEERPENSPRPCAGFINGDCTNVLEQRGEKAGCQFATLGCNDLMFNAVAPFAQFKRLFIKQEEGKKKKPTHNPEKY
ncbi:hypothetical protein IHE44_0005925 [Lamprotornis superbus]|uniref:Uncharacterized protein n=1 Tax=Lamprotornis superbus TaxID=245042 RepID=A0A835NUU2_9PASS|nr:hypothetical protein IHE44_0005925 [Lamprotornis superbus]